MNEISDFYELWQQHKQLKTMEMSEVWPDTYEEGYIHQLSMNPLTKCTSSSRSTEFKDTLTCYISQMITKTVPISTRLIIRYGMKQCMQLLWVWQVNGNWDKNIIISQWRENHCETNTIVRRIVINPKEQYCESVIVLDLSRKIHCLRK